MVLEFNPDTTGRDGDQRIFIADHPDFQLTQSLTLEAWVNLISFPVEFPGDNAEILFRGDSRGGLDPYRLAFTDTNLKFSINSLTGGASVIAPFGGFSKQWVHVAGTLDDVTGEMKLYINGQVVDSTITGERPFAVLDLTQNPGLGIGATQDINAHYLHGSIDEARISNEALSPDQFLNAPEPSTLFLLITGVVGLFGYRLRLKFRRSGCA